jgi:hypothetical protein
MVEPVSTFTFGWLAINATGVAATALGIATSLSLVMAVGYVGYWLYWRLNRPHENRPHETRPHDHND